METPQFCLGTTSKTASRFGAVPRSRGPASGPARDMAGHRDTAQGAIPAAEKTPPELGGGLIAAGTLLPLTAYDENENPAGRDPADDFEIPKRNKWRKILAGKKMLPDHRIQYCHSKVAFGRTSVDVMRKDGAPYFRGVHRCGSVWACAVCSAQISEGRRRELQKGIDNAVAQGAGVGLATFTFSHGLHDDLATLMPRFRDAMRRVKSGRAWQAIKAEFGLVHTIKALEVTHGKVNGWHPHEHQLFFTREPLSKSQLQEMTDAIFPLWLAACKKAGLPPPSREHGVQIQGAHHAAQYVGKFGFASELTRSQSKRAKLKGRTQWDLLDDFTDGDRQAGELFKEYVAVFSGCRQLVWSRGLREWLQLGELFTDDQLADPDDTDAELMAELDLDTWALIARGDWHEQVMDTAKLGRDALLEFLNWLRDHVPLWDGRILGAKPLSEWTKWHDREQRHLDELTRMFPH